MIRTVANRDEIEKKWREYIARNGRGDARGGVYRVGGYDHDGQPLDWDVGSMELFEPRNSAPECRDDEKDNGESMDRSEPE